MNTRDNILKELAEVSPLLVKLDKAGVYSVPIFYFETLSDKVLSKINNETESRLKLVTNNPMNVPNGYFENFADRVLNRVRETEGANNEVEQELSEIAPVLNTINKQTLYKVPEGYFSAFSIKTPVVEQTKAKAKVVSINFGRKLMRYAAAAIITTIIAISAYLFIGNKSTNYTSTNNSNITSEVKKLSDQEIMDYLNTRSNSPNVTKVYSDGSKQDPDLNKKIQQMSDEEIKQYLNENSDPGDIEVDI